MAAQDRTTDRALTGDFPEEAHRYSFFQVIQLLERHLRPSARVGGPGPASAEVIRIRPDTSLGFPASDVVDVEALPEREENSVRFQMTVSFLGLYGVTSPLPAFYSEEMLWRDPQSDSVRAFLDIFHHRFLSLFYRCWLKYRYHIQFEDRGGDDFSRRMFGLLGLGTAGLTEKAGLPAVRLIRYAGLLVQKSRSAAALEGILSDALGGVPIRVTPCIGRWIWIKPEQQAVLARRNCRLGVDCSIGEKAYGRSNRFRISAGPLRWETFLSFLPGEENLNILEPLTRFFVRDSLDFEAELLVHEREIPLLHLNTRKQARLGWTTWLHSSPSEGVGERSVVFHPSETVVN